MKVRMLFQEIFQPIVRHNKCKTKNFCACPVRYFVVLRIKKGHKIVKNAENSAKHS